MVAHSVSSPIHTESTWEGARHYAHAIYSALGFDGVYLGDVVNRHLGQSHEMMRTIATMADQMFSAISDIPLLTEFIIRIYRASSNSQAYELARNVGILRSVITDDHDFLGVSERIVKGTKAENISLLIECMVHLKSAGHELSFPVMCIMAKFSDKDKLEAILNKPKAELEQMTERDIIESFSWKPILNAQARGISEPITR